MRRSLVALAAAAALTAVFAVPASANPTLNEHNCAGFFVSLGSGPGFGQAVSTAAHAQAVDNFGLRNCGNAEGQNP
jgi:hypothetical protein